MSEFHRIKGTRIEEKKTFYDKELPDGRIIRYPVNFQRWCDYPTWVTKRMYENWSKDMYESP